MKSYWVYIVCNRTRSTLYIGVTSDLQKRIAEHKAGEIDGFTKRYACHYLVYCEETHDVHAALLREKQLKKWNREWKDNLINSINPNWVDLADSLV